MNKARIVSQSRVSLSTGVRDRDVRISVPPSGKTAFAHVLCPGASRDWGICNFIVARELGIRVPQGELRAFDARVFERWMSLSGTGAIGKDVAFVKDWLVRRFVRPLPDFIP